MLSIKQWKIADNERGLLFKEKQFQQVLLPGKYRMVDVGNQLHVEVLAQGKGFIEYPDLERLVKYPEFARHVVVQKMSAFEIGILFHERCFERVILPGQQVVYWKEPFDIRVDTATLETPEIRHVQLDVLVKNDEFAKHIVVHQTGLQQLAVLYYDKRMVKILDPGERIVLWKQPFDIRIETIALDSEYQVETRLLSEILRQGLNAGKKGERLLLAVVPEQSVGLLYENGRLQQTLSAGRHAFWQLNRQLQVQIYDLRLQNVEISGQEILTKDRVSLRINLNAAFRIADPEVVAKKLKQPDDHVYRRLQLALREAVGTRSLDELLADKNLISRVIAKECTEALAQYGIVLEQVGVKDIILPGEMKDILNQVVQAQKAAEANLIKRREETAATRSLHNTAKMMEGNAVLLRLKELETLEKVSERIGQLNVYGGLDSLMNGLVQIGAK